MINCMLKIAICDDEKKDREEIRYYLTKIEELYDERFQIEDFDSGVTLLDVTKHFIFDLIYLDYQMDGINGLETAQAIRKNGLEQVKFIFISCCDGYVKKLLRLGVIDFLDKPCEYPVFQESFRIYYHNYYQKAHPTFLYTIKRVDKVVPITDILFFEIGEHTTIIHLKDGSIEEFRKLLRDVWKEVKQYDCFIMPAKSYIINLDHTYEINSHSLKILKMEILIGRTYKDETESRYIRYLRKKVSALG